MMRTLFGREADAAAVADILAKHRLVSIVGPGGVGKTALANRLANTLSARFRDAVWRVELVPLSEGRQLLPALVTALNVAVGAASAREVVMKALSRSPSLLVLDNCEHLLLPVTELVTDLLEAIPDLRILQTSQEALNLREERVYRLDTLEVPEPKASLESARDTGAVALLVDRASAVDQHFRLNEANLAHIIDICRQLSGLPLAIELAAARLRTLGVEGLRDRLGDRLQLLTGGARDVPVRHRTLRAALEWSYALLSPTEQQVFRRLGVMLGKFDLAAVQSVTADIGLDQWGLLDALDGLCSKSLLLATTTPDGDTRFQLLETMRHFALDRLQDAGEESAARDRHFTHYLSLAEAASAFLAGPQQGKWLVRLDLDRDNLFAAHRHCDAMPNGVEQGLRLALALIRYWMNRGTLLQGQQVIEEAITRPGIERHSVLYATGLMNSGRLYAFRGMDREARAQYERAIAIGKACGATVTVAEALGRLGYALMGLNDRAAARSALEEARDLAAELPAHEWRPRTVAFSNLAELERLEGHYKTASPLYEQALALNVRLGDRQATMIALNNLAMMALALGNLDAVRQRCLESLAICNELDSRRGRLVVMEVCSGMAGVLGLSAEAVYFDAAARRHTQEMGRRRDVVDDAFLAPRIDRARQSLGTSGCAAEEAKAGIADYPTAVARMTDWLGSLPASGVAGSLPLTEDATVTTREREIASLIARGYSNADIAGLLEISVLTVRTHRQRLMDKLELRNAAEITAYAVRMGWYNPN